MRQDNEFFGGGFSLGAAGRPGWARYVAAAGCSPLGAAQSARGWPGGVGAGSLIGKGNERRVPGYRPTSRRARGGQGTRRRAPIPPWRNWQRRAGNSIVWSGPVGGVGAPARRGRHGASSPLPEMGPWLASCAARTMCGHRAEVGRQRARLNKIAWTRKLDYSSSRARAAATTGRANSQEEGEAGERGEGDGRTRSRRCRRRGR